MKLSVDDLLSEDIKNSTNNLQSTTSTLSNLILPIQSEYKLHCDFESPIINHRLSNDHRNISTNLSTSASLLDATTDDAMSGMYKNFEIKNNKTFWIL